MIDFVTKKRISEALIFLPATTLDELGEETQGLAHRYAWQHAGMARFKTSLLYQSFIGE